MKIKNFSVFSPFGPLTIKTQGQKLVCLEFGGNVEVYQKDDFEKEVLRQLNEFFLQQRKSFELPLQLQGTAFQQKVWQALAKIPYGETRSYQALAEQLTTSARAIGNACRANPLVIIIPCHRVVAKSGLGGFAGNRQGAMIEIKKNLLSLETIAEF